MIYSSRDIECDRLTLVIMGHFLLFYPPPLKTQKIRSLKKWKNLLEMSSFYTSILKTTIIWGTVPEIWSERQFFLILDHFLPFDPTKKPKNQTFWTHKRTPGDIIILHKCTENHDHMLYCSWDMVHHRCNCYFSFWSAFCPFTSLTAGKSKL